VNSLIVVTACLAASASGLFRKYKEILSTKYCRTWPDVGATGKEDPACSAPASS